MSGHFPREKHGFITGPKLCALCSKSLHLSCPVLTRNKVACLILKVAAGRIGPRSSSLRRISNDVFSFADAEASERLGWVCFEEQDLFDVEATDYSMLREMTAQFQPFREFWSVASDWRKWIRSWMNDPLHKLDPDMIEKSVQTSNRLMHKVRQPRSCPADGVAGEERQRTRVSLVLLRSYIGPTCES